MPVSVVVGGQFGSEGKGKIALELARLRGAVAAIRIGGSNSGHTAIDANGKAHVFRHLPTAVLLPDVTSVIGAGSYVDPEVLLDEIARIDLPPSRILIDPWAVLIEPRHCEQERQSGLRERIGSTLSGTGAAVAARVQRLTDLRFAKDEPRLGPFVAPVKPWLRSQLGQGERIIIEGTQGFGLSLLHSEYYPHVTSRDTTAAAFVAEAGLSPLDVDEVALVIRAFPIRVAGSSGDLSHEIDWDTVTRESKSTTPLLEKSSVTGRVRRVARFDPGLVSRSIEVNAPSLVCLNHVDYLDARGCPKYWSTVAETLIRQIEASISRPVDYIGIGPATMVPRSEGTQGLAQDERTPAVA
jgi:adenylosuccinate synthase